MRRGFAPRQDAYMQTSGRRGPDQLGCSRASGIQSSQGPGQTYRGPPRGVEAPKAPCQLVSWPETLRLLAGYTGSQGEHQEVGIG
jgi:hypothetical protein